MKFGADFEFEFNIYDERIILQVNSRGTDLDNKKLLQLTM